VPGNESSDSVVFLVEGKQSVHGKLWLLFVRSPSNGAFIDSTSAK